MIEPPAGKARVVCADPLGRITSVTEDPNGLNYQTTYTYDALGDLLGVTQGSQLPCTLGTTAVSRAFSYDLLGRLLSACTPESGTTNFYYTTSGGALCSGDPSAVCRRTDARSITTTYTYDALNRLTGISYSNSDPTAITYTYDQTDCLGLSVSCYNKTRRTTMTDASGTTKWAYDAMGRVLREHRTIGSVTKDTTYTYNLDGSLATLTYPSGRLVTYVPSAVGRPLSATDTTHSVTYVNSAHYAPQGALSSAQSGTAPINYSVSFDSRLRPSQIYAHASADFLKLDLSYFANNSVQTVTNDLTSGRTLNLTYDSLNRLATAQTQATSGQYCWGQSIPTDGTGYDRYGNLLKINSSQCSSPTLNLSVNTYNQITNSGFSYDNSGNMTADGVTSYVWNGAGLLKTVGSTTYTYDGDGKRVMNSAGTYYWTTPSGDQLSDTPGSGAGNEYIYFAGRRIAWVDSGGTVRYYWGDHLGTTRIVTDASGNLCYDADYYPFQGERPPYVSTCAPAYRMAGMKFDQESGDYYTLNRSYPPNLGRWMSPDPLAGDITDPQSLNRYAYVLNNPTTLTDPTGLSAPWPLSAPGCSSWLPCYGSGGIPGGGGSGSAIFGNDIFDVISGVAGYSLVYTATGLGFTFDPSSAALSPFQYQFTGTLYGKSYNETFATWDAYADWRTGIAALPQNQPGYLDALNAQLAYVIEGLEEEGASEGEISDFISANSRQFNDITPEGGNFHFFSGGNTFAADFGCAHNRCDNGLDFSHGGDSFHRDTANPYSFPAGTLAHFAVDVLGGNFVWTFIPRH
jgi:RHS repeat-associated protein